MTRPLAMVFTACALWLMGCNNDDGATREIDSGAPPDSIEDTASRAADSGAPPNIIFISVDCLRDDRLGSYGNSSGLTPNIDKLASSGVVFETCLSAIATTFPAHATMFTGLYPIGHGVLWNGNNLSEDHTTVAEILNTAGYNTGGFVSYKNMVARGGLDQGFDAVSDTVVPPPPKDGDWFEYMTRPGREVNRMALDWLKNSGNDPFFMFVHYFEPHEPYGITSYFNEKLGDYDGVFANGASMEMFGDRNLMLKAFSNSDDRQALEILHDGLVKEVDEIIGELLDSLKSQGRLSNTVVMFTGDHGQALGEHNHHGHGPVLWNVALRVPLIVHDFRSDEMPGIRISERVGHIDIAPTLMDLAGLPLSPNFQGRSLFGALAGTLPDPRVYYAQVLEKNGITLPALAVFSGRYKLVAKAETKSIFDLHADPGELNPLNPDQIAEVSAQLNAYAEAFRMSGDQESIDVDAISEETAEELRALGYLE